MTTRARALASALCLALTGSLALAAAPDADDPKPAWRNGPVRIILSSEEDKAYKALSTDEERGKWIADFWTKRDPSPGTPVNEYKDDFYKRVEEAGTKYREAATPGWNTERGKLLLLAGHPDSVAGAGGDRETWNYTRPLGGKPGPFKVVFIASGDGVYQVSEGQMLSSTLRGLPPEAIMRFSLGLKEGETIAAGGAGGSGGAAKGGAAGARGAGAAAGGGGEAAPLAPGVERLRTAVAAETAPTDLWVQPGVRYFKAADNSTEIVIDIALKRTDVTAGKPVLFASLRASTNPDAKPIELTEQDVFAIVDEPPSPWIQYGFSISLPPKPYELRVGAADGPEGKMGGAVAQLQPPDFSEEKLSLSTVTNAASSDPAAAELSADDAFRWGLLRLVPRVENTLGSKDDLSFYYQVYNAKKDGGSPTLDVEYMVEKKEASGWVKKLPKPIEEKDQHMEALGYTIPNEALVRWPDGTYRIAITVKDKVASASANSAVEFTLKK